MSKLVPNVVDTARIFRGQSLHGKFSSNHTSICLSSSCLGVEIMKQESRGRFFADRTMIKFAGGPWFIQRFRQSLEARLHELHKWHLNVNLDTIEAKDLFSYRTCSMNLELDSPTRANPIALQIVQKAQLFALIDEILEHSILSIAWLLTSYKRAISLEGQ